MVVTTSPVSGPGAPVVASVGAAESAVGAALVTAGLTTGTITLQNLGSDLWTAMSGEGGASKAVDPRSLKRTHSIEGNASSRQVREMAADMKAKGFDPAHPVDVVESGGDMFIVDGHHRVAAAKRAGLQEVPVTVVDDIASHPSSFRSVEEVVQDAATVGPDRLRR
jgi:hypothetical protein